MQTFVENVILKHQLTSQVIWSRFVEIICPVNLKKNV